MSKYLYDDYVINLSIKIDNRLNEISADFNFDYGDEFEIAICELLRSFLPNKFGICRGFVVNKNGEKAGDDIIIYDQERFPTLKQLAKNDWARKENIPIESVYCYIEAKYSLDISNSKDSNFLKAIEQIKNVKRIVMQRSRYELNKMDPYHSIKEIIKPPTGIFPYRNPIFTMIISRFVAMNKKRLNDNNKIQNQLNSFTLKEQMSEFHPEGIVAGKNHYITTSIKRHYNTPTNFIIPNDLNEYVLISKESLALAIGFIHLYSSIDWIRLDAMPWYEIFNDVKNN